MLRFARLQLRDAAAAEDVVQESIETALRRSSTFAGQSALRTWLFAIVRNRVVDHLRRSQRTVNASSLQGEFDSDDAWLDGLFGERGGWGVNARPAAWPDPEAAIRGHQFRRVLEACLERLPPATGRVFMMREVLGFEPEEICDRLGITRGNCHVMLHRARLKLRVCLEHGWGRPGEEPC
jgi:RNA polymerase sigma-70 factor (ECF subfamily)